MKLNKEKLRELIESTNDLDDALDIPYIMSSDGLTDITDEDELQEYFQNRIYEQEIIYYKNAIEYLARNDSSLQESIEIAIDHGYEDLKNINSEVLATLHYQNKLSSQLASLDLGDCFEESETDNESEEEA